MKKYYYERKNLLNHLINRVEELQNVCLNKKYKYYESFLNFEKNQKKQKVSISV